MSAVREESTVCRVGERTCVFGWSRNKMLCERVWSGEELTILSGFGEGSKQQNRRVNVSIEKVSTTLIECCTRGRVSTVRKRWFLRFN